MAYFLSKIRDGIMQHDEKQSFAEFTLTGLSEHPQSDVLCGRECYIAVEYHRIMLHFPLQQFDHCLVVG